MKVTITVWGYNNGHEFREDIKMPSISADEYEKGKYWNGIVLYESIPLGDVNRDTNFVRCFKWFLPETEEDHKHFGICKI